MTSHTLEIRTIHRLGNSDSQRRYTVDFIVNGNSLYEILKANNFDLVGRFSRETPEWNDESERVFLLESPADVENERIMLYVCPECGNIGCGAITMKIERKNNHYVWSAFAYENNYDPDMMDYESYAQVGPFNFTEHNYREMLSKAKKF